MITGNTSGRTFCSGLRAMSLRRMSSCSVPAATDVVTVTSRGSKKTLQKPEWLKAAPPSGGRA